MVSIRCHDCGYDWDYSGSKPVTSCPECGIKTNTGVGPDPDEGPSVPGKYSGGTTKVTCERCGTEWEYRGQAPTTTCPGCERKTRTGIVPDPTDVPTEKTEVSDGIDRRIDQQTGVIVYSTDEDGISTVPIKRTRVEEGTLTVD